MADKKWSQFPSATPENDDVVVGLHAGGNVRFTVANFVLAVRQGLANLFVPQTRTVNSKALNNDITLNASDVGAQPTIIANGILKGDGAGGVSAATPGTDYQAPLTAGTDYATPAQLAYVETGTTASRNHAVGEYFCWNGSLVQATSAIPAGTPINSGSGGNCKAAYATAYSSGAWTPTNASAVSNAPERNGFIRYGNILVVYVAITLNSDLANLSQVDICTDVASEMGVGSVLTVFANAPAFSSFTAAQQSDILLRLQYNNNKLTLINRSGSAASKTNRVVYANIVLSVL